MPSRNLQSGHDRLLVIGGSGETGRCAARGEERLGSGGETDSTDFPAQDRSGGAQRDVWLGRVRFDPLEAPVLRVFAAAATSDCGGWPGLREGNLCGRHDGIGEPAGRLRGVPRRAQRRFWRNSIRRPPRRACVWAAGERTR